MLARAGWVGSHRACRRRASASPIPSPIFLRPHGARPRTEAENEDKRRLFYNGNDDPTKTDDAENGVEVGVEIEDDAAAARRLVLHNLGEVR